MIETSGLFVSFSSTLFARAVMFYISFKNFITARARENTHSARMLANYRKEHSILLNRVSLRQSHDGWVSVCYHDDWPSKVLDRVLRFDTEN